MSDYKIVYSWEDNLDEEESGESASVDTIPDVTADSSLADSGLGDLLETDHDRPPSGSFVFGPAYDGTCFILKDNLLYYSKPKQPEYWPADYYIEVGIKQQPLISGVFHDGQPIVASKTELYRIQGSGHRSFFPFPMKAKTGAQAANGIVSVSGKGIFHTGPDGLYLFTGGRDEKFTQDMLEPIFNGQEVHGIPAVQDITNSILHYFNNKLYFAYQSTGYYHSTNFIVFDLSTGKMMYYVFADPNYPEFRRLVTDHTNNRLIGGAYDGYVRVLDSPSYTQDASTAITWEVQSKDFELQTRKHFPRWVKYDVDASSATSCVGRLILDGSIHQAHTITGNRNTKRRLVEVGNGNRSAIRISGEGPVTIYAAEAE